VALTVVIGGTRSGKSAHAERLALATGLAVRYVATADADDPTMAARIDAHAARRPPEWTTVQAGQALAQAFAAGEGACVLLDGLGPWIASALHVAGAFDGPDDRGLACARELVLREVDRAVDAAARAGAAIVVAEQAGEGLLPPDAGARAWLDTLGDATQRFAARASRVDLVVAGRALTIAGARGGHPDSPGRLGATIEGARGGHPASPGRLGATIEGARGGLPVSPGCYGATIEGERGGVPASPGRLDAGGFDVATQVMPEAGRGRLDVAPKAIPGGADAERARPPADADDLRHHGDRDVRPGDADHAVNVVAGGPPAWLRDALRRALDSDVARYPDDRDAVAALAALHGRDPGEIVTTNGVAEALWLLPVALRPRLAACVHPGFTEAEAALRAHGVPVVRVMRDPERGFALDPQAVPDEADLVVVGNPASPSGTLDPAHALFALRRPGRVIAVDEAFMDLVPGEPGSLVREPLDDVIVLRSITKALAIPGLRAGYAVAPEPLAAHLRAVKAPWSANALALAALTATARHPETFAQIAERVSAERNDLARRLQAVRGLRVWPSVTNFCLVETDDGPALVAALRERAIAVRPAASFPGLGPRYVRITARASHENAVLVAAIEQALAARIA
jgi:histidinol-phosphate/aromatic aminotransferase/cobyric acid decarboxylase-like protein/adenosyl cobinamide kinase/adenosyl cobinamide phosphate guanylyltransferase